MAMSTKGVQLHPARNTRSQVIPPTEGSILRDLVRSLMANVPVLSRAEQLPTRLLQDSEKGTLQNPFPVFSPVLPDLTNMRVSGWRGGR